MQFQRAASSPTPPPRSADSSPAPAAPRLAVAGRACFFAFSQGEPAKSPPPKVGRRKILALFRIARRLGQGPLGATPICKAVMDVLSKRRLNGGADGGVRMCDSRAPAEAWFNVEQPARTQSPFDTWRRPPLRDRQGGLGNAAGEARVHLEPAEAPA